MAKKKVKKAGLKKGTKKPQYICKACGLVVTVDCSCGCVDACDILCCGKAMQQKK